VLLSTRGVRWLYRPGALTLGASYTPRAPQQAAGAPHWAPDRTVRPI
jgi:hypothetical protein